MNNRPARPFHRPAARILALLGVSLLAGYAGGVWWHSTAVAPTVLADASLAAIEPASGGEVAHGEGDSGNIEKDTGDGLASENHEGDRGEAAPEAHPKAEADEHPATEEKRSHSGKVLSKEPDFPQVTIGGARVITSRMRFEEELATATPESLREGDEPRILRQRTKLITYAHNPIQGHADARVTLVEFTDLACQPCMKTSQAIDTLAAANPNDIRLVNVHTPLNRFNPVNLPAFYGKVAQRGGVFWAYRKELETMVDATPDMYFDVLMKVGMNRTQTRRLMQTEARRFYRELDADAKLTKQMGLHTPPHVYVNGIHLGQDFIRLEKLPDVVAYELKRPNDKFGYFE